MKYKMELNSRMINGVSVEERHSKIISFLKSLPGIWGISSNDNLEAPGFGRDILAIFKLTKLLGKGIRGDIMYSYRTKIEDTQLQDDRIKIDFNSTKVDFKSLIDEIFPSYVASFDAYHGAIYPEELIYIETFPFETRFGLDKHRNIQRFFPFYFLDEELIAIAFQKSSDELINELKGKIFEIKKLGNGIYFKAGDHFLTPEESIEFSKEVEKLLNISLPIGPMK